MLTGSVGGANSSLLRGERGSLREPRKPSEPELFQLSVLPVWSVMVTMVLLNEAWMKTRPNGTFFRSRFLNFLFLPALPAVFC